MPDLRCRQGAPLRATFYLRNSAGVRQPLPSGLPRMHLRRHITAAEVVFDAGGYLTRDDVANELRLSIDGVWTVGFPEQLVYDVWLGTNYLAGGNLAVLRAVTR